MKTFISNQQFLYKTYNFYYLNLRGIYFLQWVNKKRPGHIDSIVSTRECCGYECDVELGEFEKRFVQPNCSICWG